MLKTTLIASLAVIGSATMAQAGHHKHDCKPHHTVYHDQEHLYGVNEYDRTARDRDGRYNYGDKFAKKRMCDHDRKHYKKKHKKHKRY